jgi:hypothetical protein
LNIIFILALLSGVVADDFEVPPDMVFSTSTVHGTLIGFEVGAHIQPVITDRNGEMVSYWSSGPLMNYFLSIHVMERVTLEIEEVDTYIVSIGEVARIFRIIEATAGSTSFTVWRDSLEAEGEPEELLGDYYSAPLDYKIEESDN